jgi:hypothetical protein
MLSIWKLKKNILVKCKRKKSLTNFKSSFNLLFFLLAETIFPRERMVLWMLLLDCLRFLDLWSF